MGTVTKPPDAVKTPVAASPVTAVRSTAKPLYEPEPAAAVPAPPEPTGPYRLPFTLTCVAVEPGAPTVLNCIVRDASGRTVYARGHLRINVGESTSYEQAAAILQSYAGNISRDFLAMGKAQRVAVVEPAERLTELSSIVDKPFIGVAGA